ncbi:hypothetical protein KEHDKFFH_16565 [Marinobacter maroccanus]|uniref:DUF4365 domain-containing protein n=1 Tax=Marinobacter maroccanus TaxID=2055143 RepID=A0A2S5Z6N5_9GAMM|nr:hypothetical protein [Marinobacter maroccanus]PPI83049.1 hypothetical protein KEHDKFFH_16565 [Marinobacter maroccanus]
MASGVSNKLTGQVGEHLVSAVLGTLGYYASPYSGNVPGFDVTAVHSESLKSFPVQVKASTKGALVQSSIDKWCNHSIDEDNRQTMGILKPLKHPSLVWVLVRLSNSGTSGARFFICTERDIQKKIVARYSAFMEKHDHRRPGGGSSPQAILNIKDVVEFEDNWKILPDYQAADGPA